MLLDKRLEIVYSEQSQPTEIESKVVKLCMLCPAEQVIKVVKLSCILNSNCIVTAILYHIYLSLVSVSTYK